MATTALCAEKTVSASLICLVVGGLLKQQLKIKEDDLGAVIAFKEVVSQELVRRFQFDKDNVAVFAAAVDPRHSHLKCFTPTEQSQVQNILREKVQHMICARKPMEGKEAPPRKKRKETAMSFLLGIATDPNPTSEVDCFIREPQLQPDDDALEWWSKNECRFPMVTQLARQLQPGRMSCTCDCRIFSAAGLIFNNIRSSLSPKNVDTLVFLNKNLPSLRK